MPKKPLTVEVVGIPDVERALKTVGDFDKVKVATEAAKDLLPFVVEETRRDSGKLQMGWIASDGAFINEVFYASFQEWGTQFIEPTHAVYKAADKHEKILIEAYEKELQDVGNKAGLGR